MKQLTILACTVAMVSGCGRDTSESPGFGVDASVDASVDARADAAAGASHPVMWVTPSVSLEADDFYYIAAGRKVLPTTSIDIHSDPGDANYTTLELEWPDVGAEARIFLYFTADASTWWSNEIRTYDETGSEWAPSYVGTFFKTSLGGTFHGDVDMEPAGAPAGSYKVHFSNLRLQAFR
jgi:hypothetical protein